MRNRIIIIGFFILNKFFIHRCCSQNFNSEDLFELNTTVSISDYYIKRNEYVCSLKAIKNLNARLYNKMNLLYLANVYLLNKENDSMESCILRHFSQNGNILDLPQLNDKNSPYFLVYSKNREYFDSLFFSYSNSPKYFSSKTIDDQLNIMIAEDQFVRKNNALFCISEKIISPILSIDSINTIKLLTLIKYDSCCNLTIERFPSLFTLYIHLTRYDISVYNEILSHVNKCQNGYSKPIYCAMLTDNRL
ncbi:MAG: hypothetical protein Q8R57_11300, partial [Bacteroidota bacterium]|nr:hypothetical protein [Bacteroidota bacterium]